MARMLQRRKGQPAVVLPDRRRRFGGVRVQVARTARYAAKRKGEAARSERHLLAMARNLRCGRDVITVHTHNMAMGSARSFTDFTKFTARQHCITAFLEARIRPGEITWDGGPPLDRVKVHRGDHLAQGGALFYFDRKRVPLHVIIKRFCGTDITTFYCGSFYITFFYAPPGDSHGQAANVGTIAALRNIMAQVDAQILADGDWQDYLVAGDGNCDARRATAHPDDPVRFSQDQRVTLRQSLAEQHASVDAQRQVVAQSPASVMRPCGARARDLIEGLGDARLTLLNGAVGEDGVRGSRRSGCWTRVGGQNKRDKTTPDVLALSRCAVQRGAIIGFFVTLRPVGDHHGLFLEWRLRAPIEAAPRDDPALLHSIDEVIADSSFPPNPLLEAMWAALPSWILSVYEANMRLYGEATVDDPDWVHIFVDASTSDDATGLGVYFGARDRDHSARGAGPFPPGQRRNDRGELLAILAALLLLELMHWAHRPANISSDSLYAIRGIYYGNRRHAELHYAGVPNGDVFRAISAALRRRPAQVYLRHRNADHGELDRARNPGNVAAGDLARAGRECAEIPDLDVANVPFAFEPIEPSSDRARPKLLTNVSEDDRSDVVISKQYLLDRVSSAERHRAVVNRQLLVAHRSGSVDADLSALQSKAALSVQSANHALLCSPALSKSEFYDLLRQFTGKATKRDRPPSALAFSLAQQKEYTRPDVVPAGVNANSIRMYARLAALIPRRSKASAELPEVLRYGFTVNAIAAMKARFAKSNMAAASGLSGMRSADMVDIPNGKLSEFGLAFCEALGMPIAMALSLCAGLPKPGQPGIFRGLFLEEAVIKFFSEAGLMILEEYCDRIQIQQNGFRKKHRPESPAFLIRAHVEEAKRRGLMLYVLYLDIAAAFASVDRNAVFVKLYFFYRARGSVMDWFRILYAQVRHVVRASGGLYAPAWHPTQGLITGNRLSPSMWNLLIADLVIPILHGDLALDGQHENHVIQADDGTVWSTDSGSAWTHFLVWCKFMAAIGLLCRGTKLECSVFNYHGTPTVSAFVHDGRDVPRVRSKKLVGVTLNEITMAASSDHMFDEHWDRAIRRARKAMNQILASLAGSLKPVWAIELFRIRVQAIMLAGADVALLPSTLARRQQLVDLDCEYLRRVLVLCYGRGYSGPMLPCYTETGVSPTLVLVVAKAARYAAFAQDLDPREPVHRALRHSEALAAVYNPHAHRPVASWVNFLFRALRNPVGHMFARSKKLPFPPGHVAIFWPVQEQRAGDAFLALIDVMLANIELRLGDAVARNSRMGYLRGLQMRNAQGVVVAASIAAYRWYLDWVNERSMRDALLPTLARDARFACNWRRFDVLPYGVCDYVLAWSKRCRLGCEHLEDEINSCFNCRHPEVVALLEQFWLRLAAEPALLARVRDLVLDARLRRIDFGQLLRACLLDRGPTRALTWLLREVLRLHSFYALRPMRGAAIADWVPCLADKDDAQLLWRGQDDYEGDA